MKILVLLATLFSLSINAAEWKLELEEDGYRYKLFSDAESSIVFEQTVSGIPKITRVQNHEHLEIIVLNMGDAGTHCVTLIQNAFVYDKKNKKFLGEFPFQRISQSNSASKCGVERVIWKYHKNKIEISDKNTGKNYTVDF
jgi:hypothetical protein